MFAVTKVFFSTEKESPTWRDPTAWKVCGDDQEVFGQVWTGVGATSGSLGLVLGQDEPEPSASISKSRKLPL